MFGPDIQQRARRIAEMIVRPLAAVGLTPNMATVLGLLLNGVAAWILATGQLRWGGVMVLFAGVFDMFDGALARVRNQRTTFGAFFDSTLDRYSEGIVLLGLILYALSQPASTGRTWVVVLAYVAGLGSLMVSYARARAEGLGLEMKSGLMARPERVVLLSAGLILGGATWLVWTLAILATTSVVTSVQRIVTVWRKLRTEGTPKAAHAPEATGTAVTLEASGRGGAGHESPGRGLDADLPPSADAQRARHSEGTNDRRSGAQRTPRHGGSPADSGPSASITPEQSAKR
jgi:CDP-diacylglycerol--glycerol-3-phosphate 3-phosphatidyltransferase